MKTIFKLFIILLISGNSYGLSYNQAVDTCLKHIMKYEGFRSEVYYDSMGYAYIGYGHHLREGENYTKIDRKTAYEILRNDFLRTMKIVRSETDLVGNQLLAMTVFSYNIGVGMFMASSVNKAIKNNKAIDSHILKYGYYYNTKGVAVWSKKLLERREFELWLYKL